MDLPSPHDVSAAGTGNETSHLAGRLLDVIVFAPVGVADAVSRWVPRAIATGRQRVEQQVRTARWIGEMAVGVGRQRLAERFGPHRSAPTRSEVVVPVPDTTTVHAPTIVEPFAGYDSVPAAELVGMLARLTRDELEAVRDYESAGRGRRTVLARLEQLLAA
jgi:hypothetical protein